MANISGFSISSSPRATAIRYADLCTEPVAVVVSEGERVLYSVLSKPFALKIGQRRSVGLRELPAESVPWRLNAGGKVVGEERDVVQAREWVPEASGELAEEVIRLGRYGKTLTVLTVRG